MHTMTNTKRFLPVLLVPTCVLTISAVAMALKIEGWAWRPADFAVMWIILASAMAAYRFVAGRASGLAYRIAVAVAVATGVLLVWINGAVGLIGSEHNPANALYAGVLAIALIGAAVARLQPAGMGRAMFATAAAQCMVPVVALVFRPGDFSPGVAPVFGLNFCFALLFAGSAFLFRRAGGQSKETRVPTRA